ncbi:MAG TPA: hypothetical protein VLX92_16285 [Kofleriaceae bacterium]|nr:hypothetical protein [Kofleriaceae bacterium]
MLDTDAVIHTMLDTEDRVITPFIDEVRRSSVTDDHEVVDFDVTPPRDTGLGGLVADLEVMVARSGVESRPGRHLALIRRESFFRVFPQQGIFLWNIRYRADPESDRVLAAPFVIYWMQFDRRVHGFAHRFDRARDGLPTEELTLGHLRQHLLDSFTFYMMQANDGARPAGF